MNSLAEIAHVIKKLKSAVIFTHSRPDGDAIGSALALSHAFDFLGIENQIVNDSPIPACFSCLEGVEKILSFPTLDAECYISVDSSDENRLGGLSKTFLKGAAKRKITVNIDHHPANTHFCQYNFVCARSSNAENIAQLIKAMGVPYNKEIATALLGGMVTDTRNFAYNGVTGDTLRTAAAMVDAGADIGMLSYELIGKQSLPRATFYTQVISSLRYYFNNRYAVAVIPLEMLEQFALPPEASWGIVDFALSIDEVQVSACLLELKKGRYNVSLRSKDGVDVSAIAARFGGGGHIRASGCMLFGALEEVLDRLQYIVSQYLEDV